MPTDPQQAAMDARVCHCGHLKADHATVYFQHGCTLCGCPEPREISQSLAALLTRYAQQAVEAAKPGIERAAWIAALTAIRDKVVLRHSRPLAVIADEIARLEKEAKHA